MLGTLFLVIYIMGINYHMTQSLIRLQFIKDKDDWMIAGVVLLSALWLPIQILYFLAKIPGYLEKMKIK